MGDRRRWRALYVLCGGLLMIVLDATIVVAHLNICGITGVPERFDFPSRSGVRPEARTPR